MHPYASPFWAHRSLSLVWTSCVQLIPKGAESRILANFYFNRGVYPQAVGLWILFFRMLQDVPLQAQNPPFWIKNMQPMHRIQAGIVTAGSEYIEGLAAFHRGVDEQAPSPTFCTKGQMQ